MAISYLSLLLVAAAATAFERGGRYWNGRPQPIGIDYLYNGAVAVYADGPENFTRLAGVFPPSTHDYVQYQLQIFASWNNQWWNGMIIEDGDEFPSESWISQAPSIITSGYDILRSKSCSKFLGQFSMYHRFCYPENQKYLTPQKPKSRFRSLLSCTRTQKRIRDLMPKWFRTSLTPRPPTSSNFVLSVLNILENIKATALEQHNITILSAEIARPEWAINEIGDLFEEACLLVNIETFEQPVSRNQAASWTANPGGELMVLEHGQYHLTAHQFKWREGEGYCETGSMQFRDLGVVYIWQTLANKLNPGENEVVYYVNITDTLGVRRSIKMNEDDIFQVEKTYIDDISKYIDMHLEKGQALYEYQRSQDPDFPKNIKDDDEYKAIIANIKANITPPAEIGSWYTHINQTIILSNEPEGYLVVHAVENAIGLGSMEQAQGLCYSPWRDIAAKGAALRAIEWIGYYEDEQRDLHFMKCWDEENFQGDCYNPDWDE